jgi:hypothetical protein
MIDHSAVLSTLLFGRLPFSRFRLSRDVWLRSPHSMSHGWPASAKTLVTVYRAEFLRLFGTQPTKSFTHQTARLKLIMTITILKYCAFRSITDQCPEPCITINCQVPERGVGCVGSRIGRCLLFCVTHLAKDLQRAVQAAGAALYALGRLYN